MNSIREIEQANLRELELGISESGSWHAKYRNSAYIYVGGLDYGLNEGDIICVFSQFGEVVDCNLKRNDDDGKSQGFCFIAYEDQRSTIIAVDNMNGAKLLGRPLRVDHVLNYRKPKKKKDKGKYEEESEDSDSSYDERRKKVWDYEKYQAPPPFGIIGATTKAPSDELLPQAKVDVSNPLYPKPSEDDVRSKRIMDLLAKRKAERAKARSLGVDIPPPQDSIPNSFVNNEMEVKKKKTEKSKKRKDEKKGKRDKKKKKKRKKEKEKEKQKQKEKEELNTESGTKSNEEKVDRSRSRSKSGNRRRKSRSRSREKRRSRHKSANRKSRDRVRDRDRDRDRKRKRSYSRSSSR